MDYTETFYPNGRFVKLTSGRCEYLIVCQLTLKSDLPSGYTYTIWVADNGRVMSRSVPQSCGGTRWYVFFDKKNGTSGVRQAMDHGAAWARRWQKQIARGEKRCFGHTISL